MNSLFLIFLGLIYICSCHGHDSLSKMRLSRSIDSDLVVMVAETTEGPYAEALTDYVNTSDILAAARAGSPGVSQDRNSVLDGFRLNLTINVYSVSSDDTVAEELQFADVYIWHCDALGIYSAVDSKSSTQSEDTQGQKWLRGIQNTGSKGQVTFQTIVPGWYTGRILHYHIRVHLMNEASETYAITTQFFISQEDTDTIKVLKPYVDDKQQLISYSSDNVYTSVPSDIRDKLILDLNGSPTQGYTSTFNMGIDLSTPSTSGGTTGSNPPSSGQPPSTGPPGTTGQQQQPPLMSCDECKDNCAQCCKKSDSKDAKKKCKKECKKLFCEPYFC